MGLQFGNLGVKIRGMIYYKISPLEQRWWKGAIIEGVPNSIRRIREHFWYAVPPWVGGYLLYKWANEENEKLARKNPDDFKCDE